MIKSCDRLHYWKNVKISNKLAPWSNLLNDFYFMFYYLFSFFFTLYSKAQSQEFRVKHRTSSHNLLYYIYSRCFLILNFFTRNPLKSSFDSTVHSSLFYCWDSGKSSKSQNKTKKQTHIQMTKIKKSILHGFYFLKEQYFDHPNEETSHLRES